MAETNDSDIPGKTGETAEPKKPAHDATNQPDVNRGGQAPDDAQSQKDRGEGIDTITNTTEAEQ